MHFERRQKYNTMETHCLENTADNGHMIFYNRPWWGYKQWMLIADKILPMKNTLFGNILSTREYTFFEIKYFRVAILVQTKLVCHELELHSTSASLLRTDSTIVTTIYIWLSITFGWDIHQTSRECPRWNQIWQCLTWRITFTLVIHIIRKYITDIYFSCITFHEWTGYGYNHHLPLYRWDESANQNASLKIEGHIKFYVCIRHCFNKCATILIIQFLSCQSKPYQVQLNQLFMTQHLRGLLIFNQLPHVMQRSVCLVDEMRILHRVHMTRNFISVFSCQKIKHGTAQTPSSFSTEHLALRDWAKTTARRYGNHVSFGIWCVLY